MPLFDSWRVRLSVTVLGLACVLVAMLAAGYTLDLALGQVLTPLPASALTAVVFAAAAAALLTQVKPAPEPLAQDAAGPRARRWAGIAGEIAGLFARGAVSGLGGALPKSPRRRR